MLRPQARVALSCVLVLSWGCRPERASPSASPQADPPTLRSEPQPSAHDRAARDPASPPLAEQLCSLQYERISECAENVSRPDESEFFETCFEVVEEAEARGGYSPAIVDAETACWRGPCEAVGECLSLVASQRTALEVVRETDEALASGDASAIRRACVRSIPATKDRCAVALSEQFDSLADEARAAVTEGRVEEGLCESMREIAVASHGTKLDDADLHCTRLAAVEAIVDARDALARGVSALPASCRVAVLKLERQAEPWAATMRSDVEQACYRDLAADIVQRELPRLDTACPDELREAWRWAKRHGAAGVRKLRKKAEGRCATEEPIGVQACDDYIIDYRKCVETKFPEAARPTSLEALEATKHAWQRVPSSKRNGLEGACRAAAQSVRLQCDW